MTRMTNEQLKSRLLNLAACSEAMRWVDAHSKLTPAKLWSTCKRADWLLWLAAMAQVDRGVLVSAATDCAESAPGHNEIPEAVECVRVLRLWVRGEATIEEVRKAQDVATVAAATVAYASSVAVAAATVAYASSVAAYAASDAAASATVAYASSVAAYAASDAAASAAASAAAYHAAQHQKMCGLVRKRIKWATVERGLTR